MNDILIEVFRYHAWASKTLIACCRELSDEQLDSPASGFGSIIATLSHTVRCDANYVAMLTGTPVPAPTAGDAADDLDQLEDLVNETARRWEQFLTDDVDGERMLSLDGGHYECHATVVVAQAVHHGDAHREQVRAGLQALGVELPAVQPWGYALATGRARSEKG